MQQRVPAWRTHSGRTVGIRKSCPLRRETIQMRRGNSGLQVLYAEITIAHIIGVKDDNIGPGRRRLYRLQR